MLHQILNRLSDYLKARLPTVYLLVIIVVTFLTYIRVPSFDFLIGWDDQWFVTNDYTTSGFTGENLYLILTDFYYGQYAPINQFYYTIVYFFFKYDPGYYHLLNIGIHLANTMLVYKLAGKFASNLMKNNSIDISLLSFLTALLFAILPINLEPVAWVAASKVLIYSFFYLLAIDSYFNYLKSTKSKYYYLTILFFILSFGAKEQAVTLPFCLLLIDYVHGRKFDMITFYEKLPFLLLSILFGLATIQSQSLDVGRNINFYPFHERIAVSAYTLLEYFTKTVIPINLSYLYPFPYVVGENMPVWLWVYPLALVTSVILLHRHVNRWLATGLLFFLIHIALVLNMASLARHSIVADRYAYISTFGICLIVGYIFAYLLSFRKYKRLVIMVLVAYFFSLALYTFDHSKVWQNAKTLKHRLRMEIKNRSDYQELKSKVKL